MTLADLTQTLIDVDEPQWRAQTLQVVNWGGFHGSESVTLAPEVTVISGQSGAGKSSLLDAYIALMMPPNVPFNGASNDSGGGRARSAEQRNLLSYLRGKLDDIPEDGEIVDRVMRGDGAPTWGAVAMTFVSDTGDRYTAMRAYFVPARATRASEIHPRLMAIEDNFDLRDLKEYAVLGESYFPPRQLKAKWPNMATFDSYSAFSQALYTKLGIGSGGDGAKALRLLARIQASEDISTVDKLYKDLVIETPDSFPRADAAIEHFDRLEDVYQEMVTAHARADLLGPIIGWHEALLRSREASAKSDELGSFRADGTPAGLWRMCRQSSILARAVEINRARARDEGATLRSLSEREQQLEASLASTRKAHSDAGGDLLVELAAQIEAARTRAEKRTDQRARLVRATMVLNVDLSLAEEFAAAQQRGRAFLADHAGKAERLGSKRDDVVRGTWPIQERLKDIRTELKDLETRNGRTEPHLHEMRRAAAEASGLDVADLPFVGELIDVMPDESHWRVAIETALYGGARQMLVPLEHLEHFSRSIDPLHLKGRLNFEGVARSGEQRQPIFEPDRVAGKLLFKGSPYQAWVTEYVSHPSRDALCVAGPSQLDGTDLRITAAGQTRRGRRGSHGRQSGRNVIGFDNADLRAELEHEQARLEAQLKDTDSEAAEIQSEIASLRALKDAYERVADENWADIDVAAAVAELHAATRTRDEIRDNNDVLGELDRQITALKVDLEQVQGQRHLKTDAVRRLNEEHSGFVDIEEAINPALERMESQGVIVLRGALREDLDKTWTRVLAGDDESPKTFDQHLKRLEAEIDRRTADARAEEARLTQQLEQRFQLYQRDWADPNIGTTVEYYDDYAAILDEIVRLGLRERREEWRHRLLKWSGEHLQQLATALDAAVEEIEDRLDPINQILRDVPFGPTGDRLFIDLRRLAPEYVARFRKELSRHARMATAGLDNDQLEKVFRELRRFMAQIRRKDDIRLPRELVESVDRDRLLDVRRHVEITAQRRNIEGKPLSVYRSLQGKSGGEMQELIAFIVGSALRFQLGDQRRSRPRFAPVFLDEGFIKADGQFTSRAVQAWRGLGFQLVIGAPVDKAPALEPHADLIVEIAKNLTSSRAYVLEMRAVEAASTT